MSDEALKFDDDKVPLHLIDPLWLDATAQVLAHGAKKYGAWNWAKGTFEWHRLYRAAIGHLNAWYSGEDLDPETGLPHLWHANCCLMFLTRYTHDGMGKDTRPTFPFTGERETKAERDRKIEEVMAAAISAQEDDLNEQHLALMRVAGFTPPSVADPTVPFIVPSRERTPHRFKPEESPNEPSTQEETATR